MKSVIDASTLISLSKIGFLEIILELNLNLILPREIYNEAVIKGIEKEFTDALIIKKFITDHKLEIYDIEEKHINVLREKINKTLSLGDESVLALALKEKINKIITNDDGLGKIAMALEFSVYASADLLLKALKKQIVDTDKFENLIRGLVVENRLSSQVAELYLIEGKKYVKG